MITVLKEGGLRVVIFTDDHEPAHVHVFGDGHAKIDLGGDRETPALVWTRGMTRSEARRAYALIAGNRDVLLARWKEIHG